MRTGRLVLLAVGCGMDTGLPRDRLLVDLTEAEHCSLLEATDARFSTPRMQRGLCTLETSADGTCESELGECLSRVSFGTTCEGRSFRPECTAAVGDWETCLDAEAAVAAYAARAGCDLDPERLQELEDRASIRCDPVYVCFR
ncbi:MAG: hypothetical protein H6734_17605 [Alphaproteobacteria bacterium]|nr:hypothetical protein [Alphaproteobacteria bacterium]